jgi:hypothetical protein
MSREGLKNFCLPLVEFLVAAGLLGFHVHAETSSHGRSSNDIGLWDRIVLGPDYFTPMDKVFFVVIIVLLMELLNFLVKNSGST